MIEVRGMSYALYVCLVIYIANRSMSCDMHGYNVPLLDVISTCASNEQIILYNHEQ